MVAAHKKNNPMKSKFAHHLILKQTITNSYVWYILPMKYELPLYLQGEFQLPKQWGKYGYDTSQVFATKPLNKLIII